jgi:hypothetical protein
MEFGEVKTLEYTIGNYINVSFLIYSISGPAPFDTSEYLYDLPLRL